MDTRSLKCFIAIAEEKKLNLAAQRLHINLSTLSMRIQALEKKIGTPLFTRTPAGMELTEKGKLLLNHASRIDAELNKARESTRRPLSQPLAELHVGAFGSVLVEVLPNILGRFARKNPDVILSLYNIRKDQQMAWLRQGKIDASFDGFLPREEDFCYEPVQDEKIYVVLHKDHPLAQLDAIPVEEIHKERIIGANFDAKLFEGLEQFFSFNLDSSHRADDTLSALALVDLGLGIAFAPLCLRRLNFPNIVFRPYSDSAFDFPFTIQCMYLKKEATSQVQALLEVIREYREEAAA